jgi:Ca-activated chloride channel family protein
VAVEEKVVNKDGKIETIAIPVEMPDGVSHEGVFGETETFEKREMGSNTKGAPAGISPCIAKPVNAPGPTGGSYAKVETVKKYKVNNKSPRSVSTTDSDDEGNPVTTVKPEMKIDDSLKNIADRVKSEGKDGNLKLANVEVRNGKIQLILTVTHVSAKMLSKLKDAGFSTISISKPQKLVTGVVTVDQIAALSKLDFVLKIEPMPSFAKSATIVTEDESSFAWIMKKVLGMLN